MKCIGNVLVFIFQYSVVLSQTETMKNINKIRTNTSYTVTNLSTSISSSISSSSISSWSSLGSSGTLVSISSKLSWSWSGSKLEKLEFMTIYHKKITNIYIFYGYKYYFCMCTNIVCIIPIFTWFLEPRWAWCSPVLAPLGLMRKDPPCWELHSLDNAMLSIHCHS